MVKRWDGCDGMLYSAPDGDAVLFKDYAALESEVNVLRERCARLEKAIREFVDHTNILEEYSGQNGHRQWAHSASVWLYPGDVVLESCSAEYGGLTELVELMGMRDGEADAP